MPRVTDPVFGQMLGDVPVRTHSQGKCAGEWCVIHNPSDHPLRDAEMVFRMDRMALVERLCVHGVGHPDPDSVAYFEVQGVDGMGVHGCHGCCRKSDD